MTVDRLPSSSPRADRRDAPEYLLEATGLRKTYPGKPHPLVALAGISFGLRAGSSLGIVGESGSGKSTCVRLLAGLEVPDAGTVLVGGQPLHRRSRDKASRLAVAKSVQIVFQDPYASLDPRLTAAEALDAVVRLHHGGRAAERARRVGELLERVGLDDAAAHSRARTLSGGQRQRLAIARALAPEPRVILLDEATSALDVSVQAQILRLLDSIRRDKGIALLYVSHDLELVRHVCDDVVVLRKGVEVEAGATAQVLDDPQHPYTRLLLESVPRPGWDVKAIRRLRKSLES